MDTTEILLIALVLDALFGDPPWLWNRIPHPVVAMGTLISWADTRFNHRTGRTAKGMLFLAGSVLAMLAVGVLIAAIPDFGVIETLVVAFLLSQKSLSDHVGRVAAGLRTSLADGRSALAHIVGRDVDQLDESEIARAAIESASENISDGVVAPAFWYLLLGLPGLIAYKFVNTADSMIGHRDARYREFGAASARFDDLLNFIPARLSGCIIAAVHASIYAFKVMWRDARLHRSPNAGWPESAMAAVLDVALAGPRSYGGKAHDYPYMHPEGRTFLSVLDIDATIRAIWRTWVGGTVFLFALLFI